MTKAVNDLTDLSDHPGIPSLIWSVGKSRTSARWSTVGPHSWLDFVKHLDPDHPAMEKEVRPYVGGTLDGGRRSSRTVDKRFLLTLDADYADADFLLDIEEAIHHPHLIHTTWRNTPEEPRYRLIIPLNRGVSPSEYKELAWLMMDRLGGGYFDKTTVQPERFMWSPSTQSSRTYFWGQYNATLPYLPVDDWLSGHHSPSESQTNTGQPNTPTPPAGRHNEAHSAFDVTDDDRERAEEILDKAVDDIIHLRERDEFSGRNEAVFHLMPLLLQFAAAGALDEYDVRNRLYEAAVSVPADEPYTQQEFEASVASAKRYVDENGPALPETTPFRKAQGDFADISTTADLWNATPQLRHIAQAADSLGRNRHALLAATLIRILVRVDAGICLAGAEDGSVGSRAALNLGVALVGSSGQGKSTIQEMSGVLVNTPGVEQKPSTGQGLIQEYLQWDEENQKHVLISDPRRLFIFDEVDALSATAADKTSTLMSELRTMLTGGATGTANATANRRRFLPARSYNFQMMMNVQPSRAGGLLQDRDAGTPQRFIWVTVTDPSRAVHPKDRPAWPGPLDWNDAFLLGFEINEPVVDIPQWLKEELLDYDYRVSKEGMAGGEVSWAAHQNLLRLKVATGIAFLHESANVDTEHVQLADLIISESLKVQRACEKVISKSAFDAQVAKARSEEKVMEAVGEEKLTRLVKGAKEKLRKTDEWVNWKDLRPAHRDRAAWGEVMWTRLCGDPNVETRESDSTQGRTKREARWTDDPS